MTEGKPKPIEIIDGIPHEVTIFIGDGKLYDAGHKEGEPIRQGSRLLRRIIDVDPALGGVEEPRVTITSDIPPIPDDPNKPWSTC